MKKTLFLLFIGFSLSAHCQEGIRFSVEKLSKPEHLLRMDPYDEICKKLIARDAEVPLGRAIDGENVHFNIVAKSKTPDNLVNFHYHSFLNGMYQAYASHRPFVLAPDMIWLLISQGFAQHVNANSKKLRKRFADHSGKLSLIVTGRISLDDPNAPWEEVFPEFTKRIATHTGKELIEILSADFSTTTLTEKVASEITIMNAMKAYFEFIYARIVCGIPEITLKGTPADWQKIRKKAQKLSKYNLKWWTQELDPLLEEFVKTSEGKIDTAFWRNMFKYHEANLCGGKDTIDGWIVKFFPYDKEGKRNNLNELKGIENLPEEIVKVDLKYFDEVTQEETPLELWAGFVGLEQDTVTYTLAPKIGWMIRKKDLQKDPLAKKLYEEGKKGILSIRVKEIPAEIFHFKKLKGLRIYFIDKIIIPDQLANIEINQLILFGEIRKKEIQRIKRMFPHTILKINGTLIHDPHQKETRSINDVYIRNINVF